MKTRTLFLVILGVFESWWQKRNFSEWTHSSRFKVQGLRFEVRGTGKIIESGECNGFPDRFPTFNFEP
jgi:hypothetical protein